MGTLNEDADKFTKALDVFCDAFEKRFKIDVLLNWITKQLNKITGN
jgi:hypothetical protein